MIFTEDRLRLLAAPLSASEDDACKNAIRMVRDALKPLGLTEDYRGIVKKAADTYAYEVKMRSASSYGRQRQITIFLQGSYANDTNVRTQSDVDIAVVQEEIFTPKYRPGIMDEHYSFETSKETSLFKDDVHRVLTAAFNGDVVRRDKSIKINGNTYRKDTDTVPCRRYRDYTNDYTNDPNNFIPGIIIFPDESDPIINYPEQHIENGRKKNSETKFLYKPMVRLIKQMRYLMQDQDISSAFNVTSFGLESLLWNLPNQIFCKYPIYKYAFEEVVDYLSANIASLSSYKEANGIKTLCPFLSDRTAYTEFINALTSFYHYI